MITRFHVLWAPYGTAVATSHENSTASLFLNIGGPKHTSNAPPALLQTDEEVGEARKVPESSAKTMAQVRVHADGSTEVESPNNASFVEKTGTMPSTSNVECHSCGTCREQTGVCKSGATTAWHYLEMLYVLFFIFSFEHFNFFKIEKC